MRENNAEVNKLEVKDAEALADSLISDALDQETQNYERTITAIQEGLDAVAAGRTKPLEQYIAKQRARRGLPDSWPSSAAISENAPGAVVASKMRQQVIL